MLDSSPGWHRLSLASIAEAARCIDPVFLGGPIVTSPALSALAGCRITLAIETLNPVRCFKGRGADWFLTRRDAHDLVCASAGNFGQALAYACRSRGRSLIVHAATTANPRKLAAMAQLGATVILAGADFDAAKDAAAAFASASGRTLVVDGRDPEITEGAATLGLELLAREPTIEAIVVPLGNGALLAGIGRWVKARSPGCRLVGVCSRGASAMAEAWRTDSLVSHASTSTIADGVTVRNPIPEALADLRGLVDDILLVDDTEVVRAMRVLHREVGLVVEPAGALGVAALLATPNPLAGLHVATVLTGGNLADFSLLAP